MTDTALSEQIPLAIVTTYAFQWLKQSKWFPWLTVESQNLNRIIGALIALGTSVGILFSFDHVAGVLTITGLTAPNLAHVAARFFQQWAFQQGAYKGIIAPPLPGALQAGAEEHPPVLKLEPTPVEPAPPKVS